MGTRVVGQTINLQQEVGAEESKYITQIDSHGIRIHPASETPNTTSIQLDGTGLDIKKGGLSIAMYGESTRIGRQESSRFLINTNSLQAYDDENNKYFQVANNNLTWGDNVAATVLQVANAEKVATNYITDITGGGVYVHAEDSPEDPSLPNAKGVKITDKVDIIRNGAIVTSFGESILIGEKDSQQLKIDNTNLKFLNSNGDTVGAIIQDSAPKRYWFKEANFYYDGRSGESNLLYYSEDDENICYADSLIGSVEEPIYVYSEIIVRVEMDDVIEECILNTYLDKSTDEKNLTINTQTLTASITTTKKIINISLSSIDETLLNKIKVSFIGTSYLAYLPETTICFGSSGRVFSDGNSFSFGHYAQATGNNHIALGFHTVAESSDWGMGSTLIALGRCNDIPQEDALLVVGNGELESSGLLRQSNALELFSDGDMTIAGTLTQLSDRRIKEHIVYLNENEEANQLIRSLKPALFKKNTKSHVGFYAQDVEKIDKWNCMVGEMNGFKTLNYIEILAPLVTYCQNLEKEIITLKEHIIELEEK